ncbi:MAG: hypothetical protein IJ905_07220 [Fibrobacter sp.]|nr:hypothetical protein [Fibrobacter sp.]
MIHQVEKPVHRSKLCRMLGKEFYITKRRLAWLFSRTRFSKIDRSVNFSNVWIDHKSILLRKLKDVDMHLQYNKITNLKLAVTKLDGVIIKPGETFFRLAPSGKALQMERL